MASWVESIKEFAKQNGGKFVIPKRGTEEYEKVRALQQSMSAKPAPAAEAEKPKRKPREAKVANPPTEKKVRVVPPPEKLQPAPAEPEKVANPPKEKKVRVVPKPAEQTRKKMPSEIIAEKKKGRSKAREAPKTSITNETVTMEFK